MLKLTRKTEYALIAVQYIGNLERLDDGGGTAFTSVKDLAERFRIPVVLLSKVLQALKRKGILVSVKGSAGGYALSRSLEHINFLDFISIFEEQTSLVECLKDEPITCMQYEACSVKSAVAVLNEIMTHQLRQLSLADVFGLDRTPATPVPREPPTVFSLALPRAALSTRGGTPVG